MRLATTALTLVALTLLGSTALAQVEQVKVHSGLGLVQGTGIPYAAPPVGNLRWRVPQTAARWEGVRAANVYGRACMQSNPAIKDLPAPSEDCFFVNVWTPATRANERLPVMVWIHGGRPLQPRDRVEQAVVPRHAVLAVRAQFRMRQKAEHAQTVRDRDNDDAFLREPLTVVQLFGP